MPIRQKLIRLNPIVTFLGFLDTHLLIPVIALYATSLGADIGTVELVVGVYSITNIIGGRWIDKFGCKAPLIIGLCGDALAMIAYTLCQVPWHLALLFVIFVPALILIVIKLKKERGHSIAS